MKKLLLFIIILFFFQTTYAQKPDTLVYYMKDDGKILSDKNNADYFFVILPPDPQQDPNLYPVRAYYADGKLMMETMSVNRNVPLRYQGPYVFFYKNGHRKLFVTYVNGVLKGDIVNYYTNGQVHGISHQTDYYGHEFFLQECRDSTGKVLCKDGNGQWLTLSDDNKNSSWGPVINGKEEGEWQGHLSDTIKFTCLYKKGEARSGIGNDKSGKAYPFKKIYVEPRFGAGIDSFSEFLSQNVHMPDYAREHKLSGTVTVGFTIEKDGTVDDIHIIRSVAPSLDAEAIRAVGMSPQWTSAKLYGVPVSAKSNAPVRF